MKTLNALDYNKPILYDSWTKNKNLKERMYFTKTYFNCNAQDQYFFKCYTLNDVNNLVCIGYIGFYLDQVTRESKFIGAYVKPEYRGTGLASLLVSYWIKFCLENNFDTLLTNKRQRKPFLIYLLKQYYFELHDTQLYESSPNVISICAGEDPLTKYLYFYNKGQQRTFLSGTVFKADNYQIIEQLSPSITVLDNVLLSEPYYLQENEKAYERALKKGSLYKSKP